MQKIGAMGGQKGKNWRFFFANRELAREAGRKRRKNKPQNKSR
jgi:hypothetical protein